MAPHDALIARIRKILAKTEESNCTPAEAEAAFAFASRLMAEHNITQEEVGAFASAEDWHSEELGAVSRWTSEQNLAICIVQDFFFVRSIWGTERLHPETRKPVKPLILFGKRENVEIARFTFIALMRSFYTLFEEYQIAEHRPASDRRMFVLGVAKGFRDKLEEEQKAMEAERDILNGRSGGTALVLKSIADQTEEKFVEKFHPKYTNRRFAEPKGPKSAFDAGHEKGRSLNLHRSIGGHGPNSLKSS